MLALALFLSKHVVGNTFQEILPIDRSSMSSSEFTRPLSSPWTEFFQCHDIIKVNRLTVKDYDTRFSTSGILHELLPTGV
jgi:hypothetical protein